MGSGDLPADDDTFETRAQTSPLGPRRTASTAGQRPLGRATTFAPGEEQAAGRTSSTDEVVKMYKQVSDLVYALQEPAVTRNPNAQEGSSFVLEQTG